jgi:tetratricopeptide (TPR) repeat protein
LEAFARALTLDPTHAEAHNAIGVMQLADGEAQEAIASFTAAIASRPDQPHYYSNRARARVQMGQIDAAQLDYEHVLRLDPGNVGARQALETLRHLRPPQF